MSWKRIEQMREIRMWIIQIIVPGVILGATVWSIPEVQQAVKSKFNNLKSKIKNIKRG